VRLFSARLMTVIEKFPIGSWSTGSVLIRNLSVDRSQSTNRRSEFSSHSHESRTNKSRSKRRFTRGELNLWCLLALGSSGAVNCASGKQINEKNSVPKIIILN